MSLCKLHAMSLWICKFNLPARVYGVLNCTISPLPTRVAMPFCTS